MDPDSAPTPASIVEPPAPPRQRWRLVLARDAGPIGIAGRELGDAWEVAVGSSGLPVFRPAGRARPRVAFGAPVPAGIVLEHELADLVLTELVERWRVREALDGRLPAGWRLIDLYDVWLGGPALAGQVAAADYRIDLGDADPAGVAAAASALIAAERLPRERAKGESVVSYDLRPLLLDVAVIDRGPPLIVRTRTRFDPVLGTGRPEEVVAALAEGAGVALAARTVVRERVILADELA